MKRKPYPTDLTDEQWAIIEPLIPPCKPGGRDRKTDMREVVNALRYLVRGGIAWRLLPHDFPPQGTVWWYYWCWRQDGTWVRMHDALPERAQAEAGIEWEIVKRADGTKGFVVQAKRWIVERTLGWLNGYRRLSKDYEGTTESSETMIYLAMIDLMVTRLAPT